MMVNNEIRIDPDGKNRREVAEKTASYINRVWPEILKHYLGKWAIIFPNSYITICATGEYDAFMTRREFYKSKVELKGIPSVVRKIDSKWHIDNAEEIAPGLKPIRGR